MAPRVFVSICQYFIGEAYLKKPLMGDVPGINLPTSLTYHHWLNVSGTVLCFAHCCQNATAYDCAVGLNAVWTFEFADHLT